MVNEPHAERLPFFDDLASGLPVRKAPGGVAAHYPLQIRAQELQRFAMVNNVLHACPSLTQIAFRLPSENNSIVGLLIVSKKRALINDGRMLNCTQVPASKDCSLVHAFFSYHPNNPANDLTAFMVEYHSLNGRAKLDVP
jgi:hypothetical protein